jgi:hypothetical protein
VRYRRRDEEHGEREPEAQLAHERRRDVEVRRDGLEDRRQGEDGGLRRGE